MQTTHPDLRLEGGEEGLSKIIKTGGTCRCEEVGQVFAQHKAERAGGSGWAGGGGASSDRLDLCGHNLAD